MENKNNTDYPPLFPAQNEEGAARKVGLEVEYAGLDEKTSAEIMAATAGGSVRQTEHGWICETEAFGATEFYLDTKYKNDLMRLGDTALDMARQVIPVELVTEPFAPEHLPLFDEVLAGLRDAGAKGSRASFAYGFGMHLNVENAAPHVDHVGRVAQAYALLEPLIRQASDLDLSRRLLPFNDPYPAELTTALAQSRPGTADALAEHILSKSTSRNHGLDLLPCLAWLAPDTTQALVPEETKNAPRPAYHYRLPESRIDEAGWSVRGDWLIWRAIERIAAHDGALADLSAAWLRHCADGGTSQMWNETAGDILKRHGLEKGLI